MDILNPYVVDEIRSRQSHAPDIAVLLTEHFGQKGEDLIVESLLRSAAQQGRIDFVHSCYIEIGGNHPIATSASYLLEKKYGLKGYIYEANPALIDELVRIRTEARIFNEAVCPPNLIVDGRAEIHISAHSELSSLSADFIREWHGFDTSIIGTRHVTAVNLNQVFARCDKPISLLAVDIEGLDLQIIEASNIAAVRPYVVQIEPSNQFIENNDKQMIAFFRAINYELVAMTDVNLIFRDLSPQPRRKPLNLIARVFERFVRRRV